MSDLNYWIWFSELEKMPRKVKDALLDAFGSPKEIFFSERKEYLEAVPALTKMQLDILSKKRLDNARKIIDVCQRKEIGIITLQDAEYPTRLRNIFKPPLVLYTLGKFPLIDEEAAIAIVGTRSVTQYGISAATRIGYEVTKGGGLVVSGLAAGIDSAGMIGAIRAGGSCIGVLGNAIDEIYPKENWRLFEDVKATGALISEYPPGKPGNNRYFPERNRIISGLSCGVVVAEAPKDSGALITANLALEQGRDLFVVPGNIDSPTSVGSNDLLKQGAAKLITEGWDVLTEYTGLYPDKIKRPQGRFAKMPQEEEAPSDATNKKPAKPYNEKDFVKLRSPIKKKPVDNSSNAEYDLKAQLSGLSEKQLKIISAITRPEMHIDEIIEESGLPARNVLAELTMLQLKGVVTQQGGKRFSLNIN